MIMAPLALMIVAATQPATLAPVRHAPPAVAAAATSPGVLRDAAIQAARRSTAPLERHLAVSRGRPYRLSDRTGTRVAVITLGVVAGFVGGLAIGQAISHGECPSPPWLWMSTSAGGGAVGWLLTRH